MSSNLTIRHHPYFTPQLKRTAEQHRTQTILSKMPSLPIQSRIIKPASSRMSNHSIPKQQLIQKPSLIDAISTVSTTLTEQRAEGSSPDVLQMSEALKQVIADDLKMAERRRERRGYSHHYEERPTHEQIWISQPREIPRQVFEEAEQARSRLLSEGSLQKINSLQGFLADVGLFYYSVEETLMFFDAENLHSQSISLALIKLDQRTLSALYGIQLFTLGAPYFQTKKNVMILLHPYSAEMYQYELRKGIDEIHRKRLDVKSMNCSFALPEECPRKLVQSSKGYLYYSDNKGRIYKIDFNDEFWSIDKKNLSTKRLKASPMAFVKNTGKLILGSLSTFARCVKNYTLSFFASKPVETELLFDEQKEIIVVFIKQQCSLSKRFIQQFLVYDEKTNQLLYCIKDIDFLSREEEIVVAKRLQPDPAAKFNFILLLRSGKRVLIDIQSDRMKRTATIGPPPLMAGEASANAKANQISDFLLEETLMGQITGANHCFLTLTRQSSKGSETVCHVRVQSGQINNIYRKKSQPIGYRKQCFLQYQPNNCLATDHLPQITRQIFYSPHELYFSTDQIVQKIRILRPIDIFYSVFTFFSQNIPDFLRKLKKILPDVTPKEMIGFCCQILLDIEGRYYISEQIEISLNTHNYMPKSWSQGELNQQTFRDIDRKTRAKLIETMLDIAINAGKSQKNEKQKFIVDGLLQYYGKLFRVIFITSINTFTSETCKVISSILQQFRKFLFELQTYLKCDLQSYIGKALKWVNKFWQLMMLAKDIPNLPNLTVDEALVADAHIFHEHIFYFLIKECNEEVFEGVKKLMPSFINTAFTIIYRLYCEVSPIKEAAKILDICRNHEDLPDYFINYLVKYKKIPEAVLLKGAKQATQEGQPDIATYKDKMKQFYSKRAPLYEKQQILMQAEILLAQQCKQFKQEKPQEQAQLRTLRGQLKLQELIIEIYHSRVKNKSAWTNIISKCLSKDPINTQEQEVIARLDTCLIDRDFLQEIIDRLGNTLLRVMFTYYFNSSGFESMFFQLAQEIYNANSQDILSLNEAFQKELYFMLVKAKLHFTHAEVELILDTYICLLCKCPSLQELIKTHQGKLDRRMFWPLTYSAEIGLSADRLYEWAEKQLMQMDRNAQEYLYIALCCSYLVRDFIPSKKQQLATVLRCQQEERAEVKQMYALIFS